MDESRACVNTDANHRFYKIKRKWYDFKYNFYMKSHGAFWKTLFLIRLARPYSIAMCKLNLYRKYADGRCHWCGNVH